MNKWITGLAATAALAVAIPALAQAGDAPKHHCKLNLRMIATRVKTYSGSPPASGRDLHAGVVDGTICGSAFHGAAREKNSYPQWPDFKIRLATFGPVGAVRSGGSGTATPNPDGTIDLSGQMGIAGGTGVYTNASGSIKFTAHVVNHIATFHLTGDLDY